MLPAFEPRSDALPAFDALDVVQFGTTSDSAVYLDQLLRELVPAIAAGELRIVGIARRPGVQSKVAVIEEESKRASEAMRPARTVSVGADDLAKVRAALDGERIDIVPYHSDPRQFIASALGLTEVPPMVLHPMIGHAHVWLGEIDVRGMDGWRGVNRLLASAVTGWRVHLQPVTRTTAWQVLSAAHAARRTVLASVRGQTHSGTHLDVHGLHALLPGGQRKAVGEEIEVRVLRMNADEGRIIVTQRLAPSGQLALL